MTDKFVMPPIKRCYSVKGTTFETYEDAVQACLLHWIQHIAPNVQFADRYKLAESIHKNFGELARIIKAVKYDDVFSG
jgi:phage antirepressor YoqD-like protein